MSVSHALLKNVFKLWSKKSTHACLKNMIDFFKLNFITVMLKHNPLVSTSKYTPHFRGILIKKSFYEFDKPDSNNKIIERFLYERCIKSPNYRISMQDVSTCYVFKTWSSLTDLAGYLKKSRTVTSQIVTRHEQINIDGVFYIFNRI